MSKDDNRALREELESCRALQAEISDYKRRTVELQKEQSCLTSLIAEGTGNASDLAALNILIADRVRHQCRARERLEKKLLEADKKISRVSDAELRVILRQRYIDGLTWEAIGRRNGHPWTAWAKVKVHRFFYKN